MLPLELTFDDYNQTERISSLPERFSTAGMPDNLDPDVEALNTGLRKAFEEELMKEVYVASYPQFNGAIGAALIVSERA